MTYTVTLIKDAITSIILNEGISDVVSSLLIEGMAIRPTPDMDKKAKLIMSTIKLVIKKHFLSNSKDKPEDLLKELNSIKEINDYTIDGGKFGTKRIKMSFEFGHTDTNTIMYTVPLNPATGEPAIGDLPIKAPGFDNAIVMVLGSSDFVALNLASAPLIGRSVKRQMRKNIDIIDNLRQLLVHEFVHAIDPKMSYDFIAAQTKYRTRKGYDFSTGEFLAQGRWNKYLSSAAERETWPRDMARLLIVDTYSNRQSIDDVSKVIRSPKILRDNPLLEIPVDIIHGKTINIVEVMKSNKGLWRRFLLTLNDEYKDFIKDPVTYSQKVGYNTMPKELKAKMTPKHSEFRKKATSIMKRIVAKIKKAMEN